MTMEFMKFKTDMSMKFMKFETEFMKFFKPYSSTFIPFWSLFGYTTAFTSEPEHGASSGAPESGAGARLTR